MAAKLSDPQQVLETVFGFREFRPGQRQLIDAVLRGRDCIGVMPTGAGKSITFQVPAKILPGAVLVVSPLISLMKDQVDSLVRLGFRATMLNSSIEWEERQKRLAQLRRGELEIVYVAPEGLEGSLRGIIAGCRISLVVVDEAHCISYWGHDFRPAYRRLLGLKQELGDIPVLALTATATRRVALDILRQLGMSKPDGYKGSFFRPNLHITSHKKGTGRVMRQDILGIARRHAGESGIVYCASRKSVEQTAQWLSQQGVRALPYHAGLDDRERTRNQDAFARDRVDVVVATIAFGMGIDKSNVRFVVHRDMPRSIEAWYQEMGRAGRDGLASDCVILYSWADVLHYDRFLTDVESEELRRETRRKTIELFELLDGPGCRHGALVGHFDERIDPCESSCDHCRGAGIEALVTLVPGRGKKRGAAAVETAVGAPGVRRDAADVGSAAARLVSEESEAELFERLRAVRKRIADEEGVPAYIVFSDAVLRGMVRAMPRTHAALLEVSGIGPVKLARYGDAFLAALCAETTTHELSPTDD
ncbi:MAG TPA: ATP-dependent DNA helicase RecQ [Candidatus Krumholzibacteria bacterium]|nr:ATP-dependent DNA helicase RecQ [Candidatus Krumholzibacteria bacterium]